MSWLSDVCPSQVPRGKKTIKKRRYSLEEIKYYNVIDNIINADLVIYIFMI